MSVGLISKNFSSSERIKSFPFCVESIHSLRNSSSGNSVLIAFMVNCFHPFFLNRVMTSSSSLFLDISVWSVWRFTPAMMFLLLSCSFCSLSIFSLVCLVISLAARLCASMSIVVRALPYLGFNWRLGRSIGPVIRCGWTIALIVSTPNHYCIFVRKKFLFLQ